MGCVQSSTGAQKVQPSKSPVKEAAPADPGSTAGSVAEAGNGIMASSGAEIAPDAKIIFVLGGPGSGKGTQCSKILSKYPGVHHFSAGDLLREAVKTGNTELEAIMKEGKLVPMDVTIGLLKAAMVTSGGTTFLIDGFPRALDQAEAFESQVRAADMVLAFDCSEDVMRERLLARGATSGRADDNAATIVKRFTTFVEQSKPVIDHYKAEGKCVEIDAAATPDAVFERVSAAIEERLPSVAAAAPSTQRLPEGSRVIFVLGGPGAGKGTQCDKILAEYADLGVHHFSAGDLLRDAVKNGNTELEAIMKEGKLVPMEVTIGLLRSAMVASGGTTFLIDGFPRALDQAQAFETGIQPCDAVLFFDCSEAVMRERLLERGKTSGRADDNEETIVKRFRTFVEQSKPVVDAFKAEGKVHDISAMRAPEDVFVDVKAALDFRLRGAPAPVAAVIPGDAPTAEEKLPEGSKIFFVLGGPGAGKGTQCEKVLERYEAVQHFSAGDLLRQAVQDGNSELEAIMKEGKLVPMEVTIALLRTAMLRSGGTTFLIDGFPRALDQAQAFEDTIQPCDAVLYFDCSEAVMRERLLERGKTSGRADDNEETIVKRFRTFVEQSKPVVDQYREQGKVIEVSSEQAPDAVFAELVASLDARLTQRAPVDGQEAGANAPQAALPPEEVPAEVLMTEEPAMVAVA